MQNGIHHPIDVAVDVLIPEPQRSKARLLKSRVAASIMLRLSVDPVLHPVDLDDHASGEAGEIGVIAEQGRLSAKVKALAFQAPELQSEFHLLAGHRLAEGTRMLDRHGRAPR